MIVDRRLKFKKYIAILNFQSSLFDQRSAIIDLQSANSEMIKWNNNSA